MLSLMVSAATFVEPMERDANLSGVKGKGDLQAVCWKPRTKHHLSYTIPISREYGAET